MSKKSTKKDTKKDNTTGWECLDLELDNSNPIQTKSSGLDNSNPIQTKSSDLDSSNLDQKKSSEIDTNRNPYEAFKNMVFSSGKKDYAREVSLQILLNMTQLTTFSNFGPKDLYTQIYIKLGYFEGDVEKMNFSMIYTLTDWMYLLSRTTSSRKSIGECFLICKELDSIRENLILAGVGNPSVRPNLSHEIRDLKMRAVQLFVILKFSKSKRINSIYRLEAIVLKTEEEYIIRNAKGEKGEKLALYCAAEGCNQTDASSRASNTDGSSGGLCVMISSETTRFLSCSGCRTVHYCSRECQIADWPRHKIMCSSMARYKPAGGGGGEDEC